MFPRFPFPPAAFDLPKAAAEVATLATMSPFIIGTRMMQIWMAAGSTPSAASNREASRMISEKFEAAGESVAAMNGAIAVAVNDSMLAAMTGRMGPWNEADTILTAGLKPFSSRVKANHRRLSR